MLVSDAYGVAAALSERITLHLTELAVEAGARALIVWFVVSMFCWTFFAVMGMMMKVGS